VKKVQVFWGASFARYVLGYTSNQSFESKNRHATGFCSSTNRGQQTTFPIVEVAQTTFEQPQGEFIGILA
jgi:hypothetical protein